MQNTDFFDKIPIVLGVTGHRNIVKDDYPQITQAVENGFNKIIELTTSNKGQTPLVLLTGLAQGADMLVTDVAIKLGVPYVAVLPCELAEFKLSFDDTEALSRLDDYIANAQDVVIVGDIEGDFERQSEHGQTWESYRYRQVGVYIAERSHVLFGLWDGKPAKPFGCGTAEVIDFSINASYHKAEVKSIFGILDDSAVVWINCRRQGDGSQPDVKTLYLLPNVDVKRDDTVTARKRKSGVVTDKYPLIKGYKYEVYDCDHFPKQIEQVIKSTVRYNNAKYPQGKSWPLLNNMEGLSSYQERINKHYVKADTLAKSKKRAFTKLLLAISVVGALLALLFMLYDESGYNVLSLPCLGLVALVVTVYFCGAKGFFHRDSIEYRALAETLRTQFYASACGVDCNVADYYTWTQKNQIVWAYKALLALTVGNIENKQLDMRDVCANWVSIDSGQYSYHHKRKKTRGKRAQTYKVISNVLFGLTIALYVIVTLVEVLTLCKTTTWFDIPIGINDMTIRSVFQVAFGTFTAVSLLTSSFFGKLSCERECDDSKKMERLYLAACNKWDVESPHFPDLVRSIAREEIIENGIWLSYMTDNDLEINV